MERRWAASRTLPDQGRGVAKNEGGLFSGRDSRASLVGKKEKKKPNPKNQVSFLQILESSWIEHELEAATLVRQSCIQLPAEFGSRIRQT